MVEIILKVTFSEEYNNNKVFLLAYVTENTKTVIEEEANFDWKIDSPHSIEEIVESFQENFSKMLNNIDKVKEIRKHLG